jgi:hypothetical protein
MKILKHILLFVSYIVSLNCQKESSPSSTTPNDTFGIAQGTLMYFVGGGTVEIQNPAGYILRSYRWVDKNRDSSGFLYLNWTVDSSYIDKFVQVEGNLTYYAGQSDSLHVHVTPAHTTIAVTKIETVN